MQFTARILFILIIAFLYFSCQKERPRNVPEIPASYLVDIDEDEINDFEVKFGAYAWCGTSAGGCGWLGEVSAVDRKNGRLYISTSISGLSLNSGDIIKRTPDKDYNWERAQYFASIDDAQSNGEFYPDQWSIYCSDNVSCNYIGFKFFNAKQEEIIGYFKVEINNDTGELVIEETVFTNEEELMIN